MAPVLSVCSKDLSKEASKKSSDEGVAPNEIKVSENIMLHPLQYRWTLWYLENDKTKRGLQYSKISNLNTVEGFWNLYNQVTLPSKIKSNSGFALFKMGIHPRWEDAYNVRGGEWIIGLDKEQHLHLINSLWRDTLLCIIGEVFDNCGDINGAMLSVSGNFVKISVYTSNSRKGGVVLKVGRTMKTKLLLNSLGITIFYRPNRKIRTWYPGMPPEYKYCM